MPGFLVALPAILLAAAAAPRLSDDPRTVPLPIRMVEASREIGLGDLNAQRLAVADLNGDGRPDLLVSRDQVFLNEPGPAPLGVRFRSVESGLVKPTLAASPTGDGVTILVDIDGDAYPDAVAVRFVDAKKAAAEATMTPRPAHAWWQRGRGDGTFESPRPIDAMQPAPACSIAAGDVDGDGRTDLFVGNWYVRYGESNEAAPADLLLNRRGDDGLPRFERQRLPEDAATFDEERDLAGRPIYGTMIASLVDASRPDRFVPPQLIELAYGRRWNRVYRLENGQWNNIAPALGLDGDAERSGAYPAWAGRSDEKPFRSNGNTFDGSIGDIDNDGRFDCLMVNITHAWAGPSSDRTAIWVADHAGAEPTQRFSSPKAYSLDRIPSIADPNAKLAWNQGDLFGELADLDCDGRLDVVLASGDYPDPPPFDERLRVMRQRSPASPDAPLLEDVTAESGVDQHGCAQIAVADFDGDGRLDIAAGQSFHRFTPEMIAAEGGTPRLKLFLNRTGSDAPPRSIELRLVGDPALGIATNPIGAIVRSEVVDESLAGQPNTATDATGRPVLRQIHQLMGPGGHSGKSREAIIHIGLGTASSAESIAIVWPTATGRGTALTHCVAGRYVVYPDGRLIPVVAASQPPTAHPSAPSTPEAPPSSPASDPR
jgi:hypothetical protein